MIEPVARVTGRVVRLHWLILLLAAIPAWAADARVVLVLGDSLSSAYGMDVEAGWVHLLQERLDSGDTGYRVVNASISGDTTGGGAARLPRALSAHQPRVVIVELGGNDGLRGVPLEATRKNLDSIVSLSLEAGARVLLVGMRLPPNYGPAYAERFYHQFRELAEAHGVAYVPFLLDGVGGVSELMQDDGIHPRAEAQAKLLDNVWPHLEPLL